LGVYITTTSIYADKLTRITTTTVAASILSLYIDEAESVVNGYIAKQYTISEAVAASPSILQKLSKDLTVCFTLGDGYTRDNVNNNEWLEQKRENAFELLQKIADDEIRLVVSNTAITPQLNINMKSSLKGVPLTFNVDDAFNWRVPGNLLDSISDGRDDAN
jgi:hypothetical protein